MNIISPEQESQRDCGLFRNQFTSHDLCNETHERWVEARVQALIAPVDDTPLVEVRPCDSH
jgi:hypothetical protein